MTTMMALLIVVAWKKKLRWGFAWVRGVAVFSAAAAASMMLYLLLSLSLERERERVD